MDPLTTTAAALQIGSIPLQAYGQIQGMQDQRKARRFQVQQYLIEKEARARAAQRDQQQQAIQNQLALSNYGTQQAQSAMDIFGAYNRNIGR